MELRFYVDLYSIWKLIWSDWYLIFKGCLTKQFLWMVLLSLGHIEKGYKISFFKVVGLGTGKLRVATVSQ